MSEQKSFSVHTHIKLIFLSSDGPKKIGRRGVVKEKRSDRLKNSKVESNEKKPFLIALTTPRGRLPSARRETKFLSKILTLSLDNKNKKKDNI